MHRADCSVEINPSPLPRLSQIVVRMCLQPCYNFGSSDGLTVLSCVIGIHRMTCHLCILYILSCIHGETSQLYIHNLYKSTYVIILFLLDLHQLSFQLCYFFIFVIDSFISFGQYVIMILLKFF